VTGEHYKQVNFDMKLVDLRVSILAMVFLLLWPLKAISQNLAKKKIFPQQRNYQKIDSLISKFTLMGVR
jgi:hypothetical protein